MKKILILILFLLLKQGYSCDPLPDFIILENDTFELRAYLNSAEFFNFSRKKRKRLIEEAGRSTACFAGREYWKIKNDSLFFENKIACNSIIYILDDKCFKRLDSLGLSDTVINKILPMHGETYTSYSKLIQRIDECLTSKESKHIYKENLLSKSVSRIPFQKIPIDFRYLLKDQYKNGNLFADYYSGLISVEIGETVKDMRIYWHYPSDKEIFFKFKNGVIEKTFTANSKLIDKYMGNTVNIGGYLLPVNKQWLIEDSIITKKDMDILYKDTLQKTTIQYSFVESDGIWDNQLLLNRVKEIIKYELGSLIGNFKFSDYKYLKLLYNGSVTGQHQAPYACFINGQDEDNTSFIKIVVLFTYYNKIKIVLKSNNEENVENLFNDLISKVNCEWVKELRK